MLINDSHQPLGGTIMSEKLVIEFEVEQEIAKRVSVEAGELYYRNGTFERHFGDFTKEVQELIYDEIVKLKDHFALSLTGLHRYYEKLEKEQVPFEKFNFTKQFFEGENMNHFILHYFNMRKKYKALETNHPTTNAKGQNKKIRLTYLLHADYVEAKKVIGEDLSQIQDLTIYRNELPEDTFLRLGKRLDQTADAYVLNLTRFEPTNEALFAPSLLSNSTIHKFLKNWIEYFEQKEVKKPLSEEKKEWIERFGSVHLKRAHQMNYNCQRQYVTERAEKEYPEFILDFYLETKLKERPLPSEKALDAEEALRKNNPNTHVRVEWMQKPEKECEVVVMYDYLGKYRLYRKV